MKIPAKGGSGGTGTKVRSTALYPRQRGIGSSPKAQLPPHLREMQAVPSISHVLPQESTGEANSLLWGWRARQGFGEEDGHPGEGWAGNRAARLTAQASHP